MPSEKFVRIARSCNLYLSFFALGLCISITGPSLLDLQQLVNTDTQRIALIYPGRAAGYLFGSIIGGMIFDKILRKQLLLIFCNLMMTVFIFLTPWCRSLQAIIGVMVALGAALGAIDTGSNVYCLNIWGKDSGPYYQALHFAFSVGGLVAPLIAQPFLSEDNSTKLELLSNSTSDINNTLLDMYDIQTFSSDENSTALHESQVFPTVTYAYIIVAGYSLVVTFLFVIMYIVAPVDTIVSADSDDTTTRHPGRKFTFLVIFLTALMLGWYTGTEIGFAQMLATYAVKGDLKLTKADGSFVTSLFWGTFSFSRGLSVFLAIKFASLTLMIGDLLIGILAGIVLLAFGATNVTGLWVGTGLLGLGMASFFPSAVAWVERYINVTNKVAAIMVVGAAIGEMILPLMISQFIDTAPEALFYVVMVSVVGCCILTLVLWIITKRKGEKYITKPKDDNTKDDNTKDDNTKDVQNTYF